MSRSGSVYERWLVITKGVFISLSLGTQQQRHKLPSADYPLISTNVRSPSHSLVLINVSAFMIPSKGLRPNQTICVKFGSPSLPFPSCLGVKYFQHHFCISSSLVHHYSSQQGNKNYIWAFERVSNNLQGRQIKWVNIREPSVSLLRLLNNCYQKSPKSYTSFIVERKGVAQVKNEASLTRVMKLKDGLSKQFCFRLFSSLLLTILSATAPVVTSVVHFLSRKKSLTVLPAKVNLRQQLSPLLVLSFLLNLQLLVHRQKVIVGEVIKVYVPRQDKP